MMTINKEKNRDVLGLYIHIPFCRKKCLYCAFNSHAVDDEKTHRQYVSALIREIRYYGAKYGSDYSVNTVFIGGGTPSLLEASLITEILEAVRGVFSLDEDCEITIETNPGTLSRDKLDAYRVAGINRMSMGVQSLDNRILKVLGRIHSRETFLENYRAARDAGFDNINIDLMFAVPGHTMKIWQETLAEVVSLRPEHISFYSLQLEEDTPFFEMFEDGQIEMIPDTEDRKMYHFACRFLRQKGYHHYEISNCCLPGRESRHNKKYWTMEPYLGLGAGAHSFIEGCRFSNLSDAGEYARLMGGGNARDVGTGCNAGSGDERMNMDRLSVFCAEDDCFSACLSVVDFHRNTLRDSAGEFMFTGLRLADGIATADFEKNFGLTLQEMYSEEWPQIEKYLKDGLLEMSGGRLRITPKGIDISNTIMAEFV